MNAHACADWHCQTDNPHKSFHQPPLLLQLMQFLHWNGTAFDDDDEELMEEEDADNDEDDPH